MIATTIMQMISSSNYYERKRVRDRNQKDKKRMFQDGCHRTSSRLMKSRKNRRKRLSSHYWKLQRKHSMKRRNRFRENNRLIKGRRIERFKIIRMDRRRR